MMEQIDASSQACSQEGKIENFGFVERFVRII
jgi:hypothetical protein